MDKEIPIDEPLIKFTRHLEIDGNHQILFSGMFGMGKTYFLDKFFNEEKYSKETKKRYKHIYLSPVNYSVSQNEDVMEYIKYDISAQLLTKQDIKFEELESSFFEQSLYYSVINPVEVLLPLLNFLPGTKDVYNDLMNTVKKISNVEKESDELELVRSFIKNTHHQKGKIFENDFYTKLIQLLLEKWQTDDPKEAELVLVIDDLDRVDPEHIFRLFNVFASHNEISDKGMLINKFGFDKIVFVCDIENIKNIFSNRYGIEVDFNGYIDKFYSKEVFHYENTYAIKRLIFDYVNNFTLKIGSSSGLEQLYNQKIVALKKDLTFIVSAFLLSKSLNLRTLIKFFQKEYLHKRSEYDFKDLRDEINCPITIIIEIIKTFFNSEVDLENALVKCSHLTSNILDVKFSELRRFISELILVTGYEDSESFEITQLTTYAYNNGKSTTVLDYEIYIDSRSRIKLAHLKSIDNMEVNDKTINRINYFMLLSKTIKVLEKYKIRG